MFVANMPARYAREMYLSQNYLHLLLKKADPAAVY